MKRNDKSKASDLEKTLKKELGEIYTPGVPITNPQMFSGREELLSFMKNQLSIRGKVFILYGDRGVGKTSFFNVLLHDLKFVKYNCTPEDNFLTIFLNILLELGIHLTDTETKNLLEGGYEIGVSGAFKVSAKGAAEKTLKPISPERLDQAGILRRLDNAQKKIEAIVFDEAQNLKGPEIQNQMRSLVKALSDSNINVHIFFVGIAESDEELIPPDPNYSEYKMRHFTTARIPPMTISEIEGIIDQRENLFNTRFHHRVKHELAIVSSGYPSIAHTLALYSCFAWLNKNAGKLIKNWALGIPIIGKWLGSKGLKVEELALEIGGEEFSSGVFQFLSEFNRNYERQGRQLQEVLTKYGAAIILKSLMKIANAENEGLSTEDFAEEMDIAAIEELIQFPEHLNLITTKGQDQKWRLCFSRLRSIVRGYNYLHIESPEHLGQILKLK
jgi:hypothetical protein